MHLHSQSCFALRFRAERTGSRASVCAAIHLADQTESLIEADDAGYPVGKHVVLRKGLGWHPEDSNPQIREGVHPRILAKLFAEEHLTVRIRLIQANAGSLVGVRQLDAEAKAD